MKNTGKISLQLNWVILCFDLLYWEIRRIKMENVGKLCVNSSYFSFNIKLYFLKQFILQRKKISVMKTIWKRPVTNGNWIVSAQKVVFHCILIFSMFLWLEFAIVDCFKIFISLWIIFIYSSQIEKQKYEWKLNMSGIWVIFSMLC